MSRSLRNSLADFVGTNQQLTPLSELAISGAFALDARVPDFWFRERTVVSWDRTVDISASLGDSLATFINSNEQPMPRGKLAIFGKSALDACGREPPIRR